MDELQAALENIDSPEHLPTCINPLVIIAQNYHPVSKSNIEPEYNFVSTILVYIRLS